jgi:hypothetical protein
MCVVKRVRKQHRVAPVLSREDKDAFYIAKFLLLKDIAEDNIKEVNVVKMMSKS